MNEKKRKADGSHLQHVRMLHYIPQPQTALVAETPIRALARQLVMFKARRTRTWPTRRVIFRTTVRVAPADLPIRLPCHAAP